MSAIRLLMVDDHGLFRESLSRHFDADEDFCVVGHCASVEEAIAFGADAADVVLLDYDLGQQQGASMVAELRRHLGDAKVLMVTAGMPDAMTRQAMEDGASGVFLKHSSLEQLASAIRQVAQGEIWLDTGVAQALFADQGEPEARGRRRQPLTMRQTEVLRGILDGLTNKEIAWNLKASESSVKAVIQELFSKAGVRTRSQLVRIAIERHASDWLSGEGVR